MKIKTLDTFKLFTPEIESVDEIVSFLSEEASGGNMVISLIENKNISLENLLRFLEVSNNHRSNNHSFVIINNSINPDDIPDEIVVVPTLQEAEDIIEMEEIERELGF